MNRDLNYYINLHDRSFNRTAQNAERITARLDNKFSRLATRVASVFSVWQAASFVKDSTETFAKLEALDVRMKTVHSTTELYANANQKVTEIIKGMKLPLMETMEGYTKLAAATQGTNLEGLKTVQIFKGVSTAVRALKLDSSAGNIFMALEQMISKGSVQAQELKLQLGNAMPGAFRLAAQSMGMSTAVFTKEMEKGNIKAETFLTRFSDHLEKTYGSKIPLSIQSTQAKLTESANKILAKTAEIGEKATPIYLKFLAVKLKALELIQKGIPYLEKAYAWYEKHSTVINKIVIAFVTYKAVSWGLTSVLSNVIQMVGGLTTGFRILNTTMLANPYLAATVGIVALGAAAYTSSTKVQALVKAANQVTSNSWEQLKGLFYMAEGSEYDKGVAMFKNASDRKLSYAREYQRQLDIIEGRIKPKQLKKLTEHSPLPGYLGNQQIDHEQGWFGRQAKSGWFARMSKGAGANGADGAGGGLDTSNEPISVSSGRSVRNIYVTIQKQIGMENVTVTNVKESAKDMGRIVMDSLNRAILDFETAQ